MDKSDEQLGICWCSKLKDNSLLSQVSIPGTHDSAAHQAAWYNYLYPMIWRTQTMDLKQQLHSGIRYFDIRIKFVANEPLKLVHNKVELGLLDRAINEFVKFLQQHPQQFIIMQVQRQDSKQNEENCSNRFRQYVQQKKIPYLYDKNIPSVGSVRAKIWIISTNFPINTFKINTYTDNRTIQQSKYLLQNYWNGPRKQKLTAAQSVFSCTNAKILRINFMNQSQTIFGDRRTLLAHFYNNFVLQVIKKIKNSIGIVIMDYPSQHHIQAIIAHNFQS